MCFHLHLFVHCLVSICVKSRKKSSRSFVFVRVRPSISFICCPQVIDSVHGTLTQSSPVLCHFSHGALQASWVVISCHMVRRTACSCYILSYPSCWEGAVKVRSNKSLLHSVSESGSMKSNNLQLVPSIKRLGSSI